MTPLKFIFLYLPACFAYYTFIYSLLIMAGWVANPNELNPNDYEPVAQKTLQDGRQVTYHVAK